MCKKDYFNIWECAQYLKCPEKFVKKLIKHTSDFPRQKINNQYFVPRRRLENWIDVNDFVIKEGANHENIFS